MDFAFFIKYPGESGFERHARRWGLWMIPILGVFSMTVVSFYDFEWTLYLRDRNVKWFSSWMCNSIFEGEKLGGGDFSVFLMIFAGIVYALGYIGALYSRVGFANPAFLKGLVSRNSAIFARLESWYPQAAYVLFAGLFSSVYLVQTLKWTMGRARPRMVLDRGMDFSNWYEFGPYFVGEGSFRGSFSSGHTATACVLMGLGYVLLFDGDRGARLAGWAALPLSALFSLLMLVSRSMNSAHWLSDSIFSFFASWFIIHVTYFWFFDIPQRREYFVRRGHYPPEPFFFELLTALSVLLGFVGLTAAGIGARALMLGDYWLVVLAPAGLTMATASILTTRKLLLKSKAASK